MVNEVEINYLHPETAIKFGLIDKLPKTKKVDGVSFQPISISESASKIELVVKVDGKEKTLHYNKEQLSSEQNVFIGWVYLLTEKYENRKLHKKLAQEYIELGVNKDSDKNKKEGWAFPYYLIARHDLEIKKIRDIRSELYKFIQKPKPLFSDFYRELLRKEKNPIRKVAVAKIAIKFYPQDGWFIHEIADDLFDRGKYKECIKYILSVKEGATKLDWQRKGIRAILLKCYIKLKRYDEAISELKIPFTEDIFDYDYTPLLLGIIYCYKKNWAKAEKELEKAIVKDFRDWNGSILASYYLIKCYLIAKNKKKLEQVVSSFRLQEDNLFLDGVPIHYGEDAVNILNQALKSHLLGEMSRAKIKGMLAYLILKMQSLTDWNTGIKRKPTKEEKNDIDRAVNLTKEALDFYPQEIFFNALYSNLLYEKGRFDEAMDYRLRSNARETDSDSIYPEVDLTKCSKVYIADYSRHLGEQLDFMETNADSYIKNLGFEFDIETLWKKKLYAQITDLFGYIKRNITSESLLDEIGQVGGGFFEIAYSFSEIGETDKAISLYEKLIKLNGETSAVLNNLAIAYEKKDKDKAKRLIKKAREIDKNDELVEKNFVRIFSDKKSDAQENQIKQEQEKSVEKSLKTSSKNGVGYLNITGKEIEIGPVDNVPFKLLECLCPLGEKKGTNFVFNKSSSDRSKFNGEQLSLMEKQSILRTRIKELQEIVRKIVRVSLIFDESNETVFMKYKIRG